MSMTNVPHYKPTISTQFTFIIHSHNTNTISNSTIVTLPACFSIVFHLSHNGAFWHYRLNTLALAIQYHSLASLDDPTVLTSSVMPPNIWPNTSASYLATHYLGVALNHHNSGFYWQHLMCMLVQVYQHVQHTSHRHNYQFSPSIH